MWRTTAYMMNSVHVIGRTLHSHPLPMYDLVGPPQPHDPLAAYDPLEKEPELELTEPIDEHSVLLD